MWAKEWEKDWNSYIQCRKNGQKLIIVHYFLSGFLWCTIDKFCIYDTIIKWEAKEWVFICYCLMSFEERNCDSNIVFCAWDHMIKWSEEFGTRKKTSNQIKNRKAAHRKGKMRRIIGHFWKKDWLAFQLEVVNVSIFRSYWQWDVNRLGVSLDLTQIPHFGLVHASVASVAQ